MEEALFVDISEVSLPTEKDVGRFLASELGIREPMANPQWKVFFKEEMTPETSLLVLKVHHSLCDGCGLVGLLMALGDIPI